MKKDNKRTPCSVLYDLIIENNLDLFQGDSGFIGRALDCKFQIWSNYNPQRHSKTDYRILIGHTVSRYQDFLRIEQNGSLRITHHSTNPSYILRKDKKEEYNFPDSNKIGDYVRFVRAIKKEARELKPSDEEYLHIGDLLVLSQGYSFEIKPYSKKEKQGNERLDDTTEISKLLLL